MKLTSFALRLLFLLFAFSAASGYAQSDTDTVRHWFPPKLGKWNWTPLFGFDVQRTWLHGKQIKISGLYGGINYLGIHKIGVGFYWMKRGNEYSGVDVSEPNAATDALVKFDTRFFAAFYERIVYRSGRWNLSIPLSFSYGNIRGYYEDSEGQFPQFVNDPYSAMTTGLHTKLYLMTWLMPRFHIGYRYTFNTTKAVKAAFDHFYFSWGVSVSPVHLYRRMKSHHDAGKSIFDPRPI
jgi:hypothetical protein